MTNSAYRRTNKRPVRRTRRMQTAAAGAMPRSLPLSNLWNMQRPKIVATALMALFGVALFVLFDTDAFYVYDLQVSGLKYLTSAEVQKTSGILSYNIFFADSRVVERALAKLPEVKTVRVNTSLPNQVAVEIEERKPEITWLRGNETYWVDVNGVGFRARANLAELPSVRDLDQTPVKLGSRVQADALDAFWEFRRAFADGPRALEWSAARGLAYTDEHGWKIYLGGAEEMAGKVAKLRALVAQLVAQNAKIRFIDLGKGDPYYQ
jgi:cell division septal protein FtsQ